YEKILCFACRCVRSNRYNPISINSIDPEENIQLNLTTVVLVHGHGENLNSNFNNDIKERLLDSEDVNVIVVDWSTYASGSYSTANTFVPVIASYLADLLLSHGINDNLHLVGFNLGAHIVGLAGRRLNNVARITALDPSKCDFKLQNTDANYVEVIHTDGFGLLSNGLGELLGDSDFFPNGGNNQPGCYTSNSCNHDRAWRFFTASIMDANFDAHCCNSITQMKLNNCRGGVTYRMGSNDLTKSRNACSILRVNTGRTYPFN
ncbi:pancreatic lipase-related protein 2-like, partial [Aphomia sociella]